MRHTYDLSSIEDRLDGSDAYWISFIVQDNFEIGILKLEPGREDVQKPHNSDEIYFIIEGNGYLRIGESDFPVKPRTAFFVPENTSHQFHSNTIPILAYYGLN